MQLNEYRKQISNLSINEKLLRDLYLRNLALGKIQGAPTGFPSLDKPWLKYFSEEAILSDFSPMSIYQLMENQNLSHSKEVAISYFGTKISYGELLENIDKIAKSLLQIGVKKGDIVMMSMPNTPEAEYLFYAINKIGAVINSIDPRASQEVIQQDIISSNASFFFTLDTIYEKVKKAAIKTDIKKIISISPFTSLKTPIKQLALLKNKKRYDSSDPLLMKWETFSKLSNHMKGNVETVYEKNRPAVIVHTGGSTGIPKGVMLSNENFNALIYQQMYSNMGFQRNKKFLNILPPFIALGLNNAMHLAACLGLESIMIPTFEPEDFPKLIMKHKPNIVLGGPIHWNILTNSAKLDNEDFSYLEICCSGGDKMPRETQEKIQNFLKKHHAKANIWLGYGATETSAGTTCVKNDCFRFESVGAPYLNNVLKVCDTDTGDELREGEVGELMVQGPTLMMGYFGEQSKETSKVIVEDQFGTKWYKTGDLAHFDKDGMIYIDGRIKRMITRRGFKIYPAHVESLIMQHPAVKECAVVGVKDPEELNIPVANIVINEGLDTQEMRTEIKSFVDKTIEETLPDYSVMAGYNFLSELPKTPIGKLDFKKLEEMGINDNQKTLQKKFSLNNSQNNI